METLNSSGKQSWLSWFLRGVVALGFLIIITRLIDLQIIRGAYYRDLADGNRIRRVSIAAPRGKILARGGEVLVGNNGVNMQIVFDEKEGYEKVETQDTKEAIDIVTEPIRDYVLGPSFSHTGGYLGEVSEDEVGLVRPGCLEKGPMNLGGLVGRTGLEQEYDCQLSGIDGEELIEVSSNGKIVRTLGRLEPVPGDDVRTNIDFGLQKYLAKLMEGEVEEIDAVIGAVIVTDTQGEVLGMYSAPSFDPNIFINGSGKIDELFTDTRLPLFNRVIGGKYPSGSVVKPVVSIAGLQEGVIDRDYRYTDTGQIIVETPYGNFTYNNWYLTQYGGTEGEIDLSRAIARSTDTFFYKLGELIGVDNLVVWFNAFGYGDVTGIDLPGEVSGFVPTPEWKRIERGERWFLGNTYHISIGQGDLAISPIEVNTAISAIASGGELCRPHLVNQEEKENCKDLKLDIDNISFVKEGMKQACSDGGTAYTFFDVADVACKTGTAQIAGSDDTHAWFTFFSPINDPEIVVTVLVERGGEGSRDAGPIARKIYDYWFIERDSN